MEFKTAFSNHYRVLTPVGSKSMTQQHMKAECDINNIMRIWQKTGVIDHVNTHAGNYGDFLSAVDYQSACNAVIAADEAFSSLPSSLRKRFDNSPAVFLEFVQNPDNLDEMYDLGLAIKPNNNTPPEEEPPSPE